MFKAIMAFQTKNNKMHGVVMSDLHYGAHFSSAKRDRIENQIHRAIEGKDICVLNGDILEGFDLPDIENDPDNTKKAYRSLERGRKWLMELFDRHPDTKFVLVGGNHDGLKQFDELYAELANHPSYKDRVDYYPSAFQCGNAVFLHGDMPLHGNKLYRDINHLPTIEDAAQPDFTNNLHRLAAPGATWINKLGFYAMLTTESVEKTLNKYIFGNKSEQPAMSANRVVGKGMDAALDHDSVEHVFIGHTHQAYMGRRDEYNRQYYNTGGTVKGAAEVFNPLSFEVDPLSMNISNISQVIERKHEASIWKFDAALTSLAKHVKDAIKSAENAIGGNV